MPALVREVKNAQVRRMWLADGSAVHIELPRRNGRARSFRAYPSTRKVKSAQTTPLLLKPYLAVYAGEQRFWLYGEKVYETLASDGLSAAYVKEIVDRSAERRRQQVARETGRAGRQPEGARRQAIPQQVKSDVWNRDGGRCVECGSNRNLEFDHIIPLDKGGANTFRNLQLLCEVCNRAKGVDI